MSGHNNDDYFDLDNFDDEIYSDSSQAEEAPDKKTSPKSSRTKARERRIKTLKNRSLIIIIGIAILALVIVLFVFMVKGCGSGKNKVVNVSTETKFKQEGRRATPSEANSSDKSGSNGSSASSNYKKPEIKDDNSPAEVYGECCVWKESGNLRFSPDDGSADAYASAVNSLAQQSSSLKFYSIVAPSSTEICLPDRLKNGDFTSASQSEFLAAVDNSLDSSVTSVNAYNALSEHNSDYIYYKSDNKWTDLGAYYAYSAFANAAGLTPLDLGSCEDKTIDGFYGNYSTYTATAGEDTVHYRYLPYEATMDVTDQNGNTFTNPSPYYEGATSGSLTYGVFLVGDNPLSVIHSSSEAANGDKKIAVVKEDYGDAIAPYLTYNYSEVHVIDYRYFDMMGVSFADYCSQNGITDVLVVNDIQSAGSQTQIDTLKSI